MGLYCASSTSSGYSMSIGNVYVVNPLELSSAGAGCTRQAQSGRSRPTNIPFSKSFLPVSPSGVWFSTMWQYFSDCFRNDSRVTSPLLSIQFFDRTCFWHFSV